MKKNDTEAQHVEKMAAAHEAWKRIHRPDRPNPQESLLDALHRGGNR